MKLVKKFAGMRLWRRPKINCDKSVGLRLGQLDEWPLKELGIWFSPVLWLRGLQKGQGSSASVNSKESFFKGEVRSVHFAHLPDSPLLALCFSTPTYQTRWLHSPGVARSSLGWQETLRSGASNFASVCALSGTGRNLLDMPSFTAVLCACCAGWLKATCFAYWMEGIRPGSQLHLC